MNEVRTGIIGVGNMGFAHSCCIYNGNVKGMQLAALCDIDEQKRRKCEANFKNIPVFSDYKEMLKSKLIDSVIIAVPHRLHSQIAIEAFEQKLNVMTEKPADISVSAARAMNEAAEKSGKVFGIMFNQRTNSIYKKAKNIVENGVIGELKRSVWIITNWYRTQSYYDSGSWRATWSGEGGGVLINQAPHNLDLWQWICGMPSSITSFCDRAKYHNIEVEDDVTIFARYKNGGTGTFITSTGELPGTNRLEISGTLGKLVIENGMLKLWKNSVDERKICFNSEINPNTVSTDYSEYIPTEKESAHCGILQNFTDNILKGTPLIASGYEGINSLTISNAAYLSEWSGNKEICLPINENEFDRLLLQKINSSKEKNSSVFLENQDGQYHKRWQVNW